MTQLKQFIIKETTITTIVAVVTALDARDAKLRFKKGDQTDYHNFESDTQTKITAAEGEK